MSEFKKDLQFYKFCAYGFIKNLKFFDPFIILFFRQMGFSFLQIGVLYSVREISTNVFEMPTGVIADALGRRASMVFAFASYIISFLVFYFFRDLYVYIGAMILFAMGEAFRSGTHKAMILEYLKIKGLSDKKVSYYGSTRACSQFGSAISSLIAAALVFFSGNYRIIFLGSIVPYVFGLLLMLSYPKMLDGEKAAGECNGRYRKMLNNIKQTVNDFLAMFKNKDTIKALLSSSLFDAYFKSVKDYLQPVLKTFALALPLFLALSDKKRVAVIIGIVYFVLFLLTSFASKNSGKAVKRVRSLPHGLNVSFVIGAFFIFLGGIFYNAHIFSGVIIVFVLYYMLQNVRRPMCVSYVSDLISSRVMATGLSAESQMKTVLLAVIAPMLGWLIDRFGIGISLIIFSIAAIASYSFVKLKSERTKEVTGGK